jgi:hypothetical protein
MPKLPRLKVFNYRYTAPILWGGILLASQAVVFCPTATGSVLDLCRDLLILFAIDIFRVRLPHYCHITATFVSRFDHTILLKPFQGITNE